MAILTSILIRLFDNKCFLKFSCFSLIKKTFCSNFYFNINKNFLVFIKENHSCSQSPQETLLIHLISYSINSVNYISTHIGLSLIVLFFFSKS